LRELLISEHHNLELAGHLGVFKTLQFLQRQYHWPAMKTLVKAYIKSCEFCQRNKHSNAPPAGKLQPLDIPESRWSSVSMDFITQLPKTPAGFDAFIHMVVVDL